jgi:hypothetical protein
MTCSRRINKWVSPGLAEDRNVEYDSPHDSGTDRQNRRVRPFGLNDWGARCVTETLADVPHHNGDQSWFVDIGPVSHARVCSALNTRQDSQQVISKLPASPGEYAVGVGYVWDSTNSLPPCRLIEPDKLWWAQSVDRWREQPRCSPDREHTETATWSIEK